MLCISAAYVVNSTQLKVYLPITENIEKTQQYNNKWQVAREA